MGPIVSAISLRTKNPENYHLYMLQSVRAILGGIGLLYCIQSTAVAGKRNDDQKSSLVVMQVNEPGLNCKGHKTEACHQGVSPAIS